MRLRGVFQRRGPARQPLNQLAMRAGDVAMVGVAATGLAAICCRPASGPEFAAAREHLGVAVGPRVRLVHWEWDAHGHQWALVSGESLRRLALATARAEHTLEQRGYANLLVCTAFGLRDLADQPVHLVYDHRARGFYPFMPRCERTRDAAAERTLAEALERTLPVVADQAQWAPVWDSPLVAGA